MATLTSDSIDAVHARCMRHAEEALDVTKAQLRAAVVAADGWVSSNAASFNTAIPADPRAALTTAQKVFGFVLVLRYRFEVGVAATDALSSGQVDVLLARTMRLASGALAVTKADLRAALVAIDGWIAGNAASFNAALPVAARNNLAAIQKVRLLTHVLDERYDAGVLT